VKSLLSRRVGEIELVLWAVNVQHPLEPRRQATAVFTARVDRAINSTSGSPGTTDAISVKICSRQVRLRLRSNPLAASICCFGRMVLSCLHGRC
jgi:hypothetical protein